MNCKHGLVFAAVIDERFGAAERGFGFGEETENNLLRFPRMRLSVGLFLGPPAPATKRSFASGRMVCASAAGACTPVTVVRCAGRATGSSSTLAVATGPDHASAGDVGGVELFLGERFTGLRSLVTASASCTPEPVRMLVVPEPMACAPTHCMNWPIERTRPSCFSRKGGIHGSLLEGVIANRQRPIERLEHDVSGAQGERVATGADGVEQVGDFRSSRERPSEFAWRRARENWL